jgi:hypothetical protein
MDCYAIGDHAEFAKTVSEYDVYGFAGIVGDFYGVHVNEEYAKTTRFEKRIAQGALSVGFLATVMGTMAAKAPEPRRRLAPLRHHLHRAGLPRRHRHRPARPVREGRGAQHLRLHRHRDQPEGHRGRERAHLPQGAVTR